VQLIKNNQQAKSEQLLFLIFISPPDFLVSKQSAGKTPLRQLANSSQLPPGACFLPELLSLSYLKNKTDNEDSFIKPILF